MAHEKHADQIEKERDALHETLKELQSRIKQLLEEIAALKKRIAELEGERADYENASVQRRFDVARDTATLQKNFEQEKNKNEDLLKQLEEAVHKLDVTKAEVELLKKQKQEQEQERQKQKQQTVAPPPPSTSSMMMTTPSSPTAQTATPPGTAEFRQEAEHQLYRNINNNNNIPDISAPQSLNSTQRSTTSTSRRSPYIPPMDFDSLANSSDEAARERQNSRLADVHSMNRSRQRGTSDNLHRNAPGQHPALSIDGVDRRLVDQSPLVTQQQQQRSLQRMPSSSQLHQNQTTPIPQQAQQQQQELTPIPNNTNNNNNSSMMFKTPSGLPPLAVSPLPNQIAAASSTTKSTTTTTTKNVAVSQQKQQLQNVEVAAVVVEQEAEEEDSASKLAMTQHDEHESHYVSNQQQEEEFTTEEEHVLEEEEFFEEGEKEKQQQTHHQNQPTATSTTTTPRQRGKNILANNNTSFTSVSNGINNTSFGHGVNNNNTSSNGGVGVIPWDDLNSQSDERNFNNRRNLHSAQRKYGGRPANFDELEKQIDRMESSFQQRRGNVLEKLKELEEELKNNSASVVMEW